MEYTRFPKANKNKTNKIFRRKKNIANPEKNNQIKQSKYIAGLESELNYQTAINNFLKSSVIDTEEENKNLKKQILSIDKEKNNEYNKLTSSFKEGYEELEKKLKLKELEIKQKDAEIEKLKALIYSDDKTLLESLLGDNKELKEQNQKLREKNKELEKQSNKLRKLNDDYLQYQYQLKYQIEQLSARINNSHWFDKERNNVNNKPIKNYKFNRQEFVKK